MECARCGAVFEGRFCPRCGAPSNATAPAATGAPGWPCPRCGTEFRGNFCPQCGLSTAAWSYQPPPAPSSGRSILTILWTLAIVSFLVLAALSFVGLALAPSFVVPGIQGIRSGETANSGLDFSSTWTFDEWGSTSTDQYEVTGGNPGGYLEMTLPGTGDRGYWYQPFRVEGSAPYAAVVMLDVLLTGGLSAGWLMVSVEPSTGPPSLAHAVTMADFQGSAGWTTLDPIDADRGIPEAGTYFLKVAFVANATVGPVSFGIDNVLLSWTTAAFVFFYVPAPFPVVFFVSQEPTLFLSYFAVLLIVTVLAGAYHAIRERGRTREAFVAPVTAIGTRLRSRSAWISVAQVWMAVTFFQIAFILLVTYAGIETPTPIEIGDETTVWVPLYELANAGVYEEIAFRVFLIGAPMAVGSLVLRTMDVNRGGGRSDGPGSASRHITGGWRYLAGGAVTRSSGRETLVAAWALLIVSSALFGIAHFPGWGLWKVLPSTVAGLGFGYLFLRHGVGAAILAHFVNDYAFSLYYEGISGLSMEVFLSLMFLGLTIAGSGFFLWYVLEAWSHARDLLERFRPRAIRIRPAAAVPSVASPMPSPPSMAGPVPGPQRFEPPMQVPATTTVGAATIPRDSLQLPRDYTPTYRAPPYGYPPVRFQCPSCGWVEARYDTGRFTCTRCGRTA